MLRKVTLTGAETPEAPCRIPETKPTGAESHVAGPSDSRRGPEQAEDQIQPDDDRDPGLQDITIEADQREGSGQRPCRPSPGEQPNQRTARSVLPVLPDLDQVGDDIRGHEHHDCKRHAVDQRQRRNSGQRRPRANGALEHTTEQKSQCDEKDDFHEMRPILS